MCFAFASLFLFVHRFRWICNLVFDMHSQVSTENTQSFDFGFNLLCAAAVALVLDACLMVSHLRRNKDDGAKAASANCVANIVHKQRRKSIQVRKCLRLGLSRKRLLFYYICFCSFSPAHPHPICSSLMNLCMCTCAGRRCNVVRQKYCVNLMLWEMGCRKKITCTFVKSNRMDGRCTLANGLMPLSRFAN